jgi:hypothetical protein
MVNLLTSVTKKRIIRELRQILYDHPRYRVDSGNVQNKFAFTERPQRGIIVTNSTADRVKLSSNNYIGRLSAFCMLMPWRQAPGTSIEWVRENDALLEQFSKKRDIFPTPPGVYTVTVTSLPDEGHGTPGQFTIDPILTVRDEPLITFDSSFFPVTAQISHENIYPQAVWLWLDGRRQLVPDVDYSVDWPTGLVTFLKTPPTGSTIYADYRYQMPEQGPYPFQSESTDTTALPGVVIAFGDRIQCDKLSIVVTDTRTDVAEIYGGKFEVNFSLNVFTRDTEDREKMSDYVIIKVLERQNILGFEGLELLDISPGGEEEEVYNAEIDDYYYQSTVSLTIRVDWELQQALPIVLSRLEQTSKPVEDQTGFLDGTAPNDLIKIGRTIELAGKPAVSGYNLGYERMR